jgi:hypothetical protein
MRGHRTDALDVDAHERETTYAKVTCRRVRGLVKPSVARVLDDASFAYLAVESSSGPHAVSYKQMTLPTKLEVYI